MYMKQKKKSLFSLLQLHCYFTPYINVRCNHFTNFAGNCEKIYDMKILCEIKTGWFASKHQQFLNVCFACL